MKDFRHTLLALALLVPTAGIAKPTSTGGAMALERSQFIGAMDAEFRKLDANNDGILLELEIEESQRRSASAAAVDRFDKVFKQLDRDKDGKLSTSEFRALVAKEAKPVPDPKPVLARFDRDRDGKIALIEYRVATQANFDRVDTDRDGSISAQELKAGKLNQ